jgi:hypothetical protein
MPRVYADDEVVTVRTADVRNTDLLARGRGQFDGGYTGVGVVRCGWAGFQRDWNQEVWRLELADGSARQQPGYFPVTIVRRDLGGVA